MTCLEQNNQMQPIDAVADAMLCTQWKIVRGVYVGDHDGRDDWRLEIGLRIGYDSYCVSSSVYSLYYLNTRYNDLFENLAILSGTHDKEKPLRKNWRFHTYFLAKGKDNIWYAGSPGNYTENGDPTNPIKTIYKSRDINQIVNSIKEKDFGIWPEGSFIDETTRLQYEPSKVIAGGVGKPKTLHSFYIRSRNGNNRASMATFRVKLAG